MEFNINFFVVVMEILVISCLSNACDTSTCVASNGAICNNNGVCDCGVCTCNEKHSGPTCEEGCDKYAGCVGCKIFGTGPVSIIDCLLQCDDIATYLPVYKEEFDASNTSDNNTLCQILNYKYCMESFRIGGMRDGYRDLFVRTEEDCDPKYRPTEPTKPPMTSQVHVTLAELEETTAAEITTKQATKQTTKRRPVTKATTIKYEVEINDSNDFNDDSNDVKHDVDDDGHKPQDNVAPVAGSSRDNTFDNNGTNMVQISNICVLLISLYYMLS